MKPEKPETTRRDPIDFIRTHTQVVTATFVPELPLYIAIEDSPFWKLNEDRLRRLGDPPAFWAFAWPGGQGLARYFLDNPDTVRGKRVLDFGAGSGIAAIAAMKSGAARAVAVDIDPMAHVAIQQNALLNEVRIEGLDYISMDKVPKHIDAILVGDMCYEQLLAARLSRWLWLCVTDGIRVILADPGRAYVPKSGLAQLAVYTVPTSRAIELDDNRTVRVWDVGLPTED
jgi:predicted nicotinamide N-methyase